MTRKAKIPAYRRIRRDDRQQAFDFQGAAGHQEQAAPSPGDDYWTSADARYPLLGGHMIQLYGQRQGETCGGCLNYQFGRCSAYSDNQAGWSRSWPACGAFNITDRRKRTALCGFDSGGRLLQFWPTMAEQAGEPETAVPTGADGPDDGRD